MKARIKALCDAEVAGAVLSDDALVDLLKAEGFDLARRTVAKYREAIGIGSSCSGEGRRSWRGWGDGFARQPRTTRQGGDAVTRLFIPPFLPLSPLREGC